MVETVNGHEQEKDFLTEKEFKKLLDAAKKSRYPERDQLIILMLYRHGLRESELCLLKRSALDLDSSRVWITRIKNGLSTHHPIEGDELRMLRRYLKTRTDKMPWLFVSERLTPLTRHQIIYIVKRSANHAQLKCTPHNLRHSCGYYLANKGYDLRLIQDYLGHRDPKHTAKYTRTAAKRFQGLWE